MSMKPLLVLPLLAQWLPPEFRGPGSPEWLLTEQQSQGGSLKLFTLFRSPSMS